MERCRNCRWWGEIPESLPPRLNPDDRWGVCEVSPIHSLALVKGSGQLVTRADFGCVQWTLLVHKTVTAVAVAVTNKELGRDASKRLEAAMAAEVQRCIDDGIMVTEENASLIRDRTIAAHDKVLAEIKAGR